MNLAPFLIFRYFDCVGIEAKRRHRSVLSFIKTCTVLALLNFSKWKKHKRSVSLVCVGTNSVHGTFPCVASSVVGWKSQSKRMVSKRAGCHEVPENTGGEWGAVSQSEITEGSVNEGKVLSSKHP